MTHTPNPIYENKSGRTTLSLVLTILITGGVFLVIPLTQLSSERPPVSLINEKNTLFVSPPPEPPEPPNHQNQTKQKRTIWN